MWLGYLWIFIMLVGENLIVHLAIEATLNIRTDEGVCAEYGEEYHVKKICTSEDKSTETSLKRYIGKFFEDSDYKNVEDIETSLKGYISKFFEDSDYKNVEDIESSLERCHSPL